MQLQHFDGAAPNHLRDELRHLVTSLRSQMRQVVQNGAPSLEANHFWIAGELCHCLLLAVPLTVRAPTYLLHIEDNESVQTLVEYGAGAPLGGSPDPPLRRDS